MSNTNNGPSAGILVGVPFGLVLWVVVMFMLGPKLTLEIAAAIGASILFAAVVGGFFFNIP